MEAPASPSHLSQADFARRRKVSRKAVTGWKAKGLLVLADDGRVDVEATEWKLDERPAKYRGGVTHRPVRAAGNKLEGNKPSHPKPKASAPERRQAPRRDDADRDPEGEVLDLESQQLTLAEAARRKENFLGLKHKQEFEKNERALVDREIATKLFFDTARDLRDAWLSWPARIGILMADELKIDARTLTTVLTAHVQQHLAELGEPHADLG